MLVMLLCGEKKSSYLKLKLEINTILLFVLLVCLFTVHSKPKQTLRHENNNINKLKLS